MADEESKFDADVAAPIYLEATQRIITTLSLATRMIEDMGINRHDALVMISEIANITMERGINGHRDNPLIRELCQVIAVAALEVDHG